MKSKYQELEKTLYFYYCQECDGKGFRDLPYFTAKERAIRQAFHKCPYCLGFGYDRYKQKRNPIIERLVKEFENIQ